MKEEQNASSSANYDVEIFHASFAHTAILKGNAEDSSLFNNIREGSNYETVLIIYFREKNFFFYISVYDIRSL